MDLQCLLRMCHRAKGVKVKKVVKIPNNRHLLKVIFYFSETADNMVANGLQVHYQKSEKRCIERELYIPISPCYKCYSYSHLKNNCDKPENYKICSNCSREGHLFLMCKSIKLRCINCKGEHRTLAARCPKRKEIIRNKIKERKERTKSKTKGDETSELDSFAGDCHIARKLSGSHGSNNINCRKARERSAGNTVYQFRVDEMMKANDMPMVKFRDSVIRDYKATQERRIEEVK